MHTFNDIDARIKNLEEEIRQLRSFRNSLTTVNRLPVEVLTDIFSLCQRPLQLTNSNPKVKISWITLSHTCQHWRDAFLQRPSLWMEIPMGMKLPVIERWLEHSNKSPISVLVTETTKSEAIQRVFQELGRIRYLRLECENEPGESWDDLWSRLRTSAPALTYLKIHSSDDSRYLELPGDLLRDGAPLLQTVSLHRCDFTLDLPVLKSLVDLHISDSATLFPLNEMAEILRAMPQLQFLFLNATLEESTGQEGGQGSGVPSKANLPSLRTLELRHRCKGNLGLLSHITIADTAKIVLVQSRVRSSDLALLKSFSEEWLRVRGDTVSSPNVTNFELVWDAATSTAKLFFNHKQGRSKSNVQTNVETTFNIPGFDPDSLFGHFVTAPLLYNVTVFKSNMFISAGTLQSVLASIKPLSSLVLTDDAVPAFLQLLTNTQPGNASKLLPGLSSLQLSVQTGIQRQYIPLSFGGLRDFLEAKLKSHKVKKLIVSEIILNLWDPKLTLALSKAVGTVDWRASRMRLIAR